MGKMCQILRRFVIVNLYKYKSGRLERTSPVKKVGRCLWSESEGIYELLRNVTVRYFNVYCYDLNIFISPTNVGTF